MTKFDDVDHQIQLVLHELDRRQDGQSRRLGSAETIAGALVAASVLVATLFSQARNDGWLVAALVLALVAALLGVVTFMPRQITELNPATLRQEVLGASKVAASIWLIDQRIALIERRESLIRSRYSLVRWGLISLVGSILLVICSVSGIEIRIVAP